ncbi:transposase family protein [Amycolatopsis cihanbeyliensis]|uniref:DDE superfamily endonuclease n=1 Tax=Amycolatopsis cihanbeyliensis TaxID=1128664 RepID=A0A542CTY2_AMYCI|nr:transposase family protein [Amycolatopsis cihanbeyliensis]TQI94273.1 DDE superfamily endonuclease [Amycolatopsis cihanbeyliensis]TQI94669.1 DDE superfamily endonuclease [Amycolatopsis cihanbeyliensis]
MIAYRAILDVPRELAWFLSRLLHAERRERGTRRGSRALTCFRQAVFGLRWFRDNRDVAALARDHRISRATGYRYLTEVIEVLAAQAPDLHDALCQAKAYGAPHLVLDGTVFSTDRLGEKTTSVKGEQIDAWYSGKARKSGGNVQALMDPDGFPLWVSEVEPGSVHDLTAARDQVLGALYWAASRLDLSTLADPGYEGAGIGVHTPIKQPANGRALDADARTYNALLRSLRCLGERGFALLTGRWRSLRHLTTSPRRIDDIVQAALVLTHFEHGRLT